MIPVESPKHMCKPSLLAGLPAHRVKRGSTVVCGCGNRWVVTQNHVGRICGCGWLRVTTDEGGQG